MTEFKTPYTVSVRVEASSPKAAEDVVKIALQDGELAVPEGMFVVRGETREHVGTL